MVRPPARGGAKFALIGNHRCLDFVNTEVIHRGHRVDLLSAFPDLVAWLTAAQLVEPSAAKDALRRWSGTTAGARAVMEARTLRGCFRAMLEHIEGGRPITASTLEAINVLLARPVGHGELVRVRHG